MLSRSGLDVYTAACPTSCSSLHQSQARPAIPLCSWPRQSLPSRDLFSVRLQWAGSGLLHPILVLWILNILYPMDCITISIPWQVWCSPVRWIFNIWMNLAGILCGAVAWPKLSPQFVSDTTRELFNLVSLWKGSSTLLVKIYISCNVTTKKKSRNNKLFCHP